MSEELPLVSVAIITYNQKEFLRECIESCLDQTYSNIEIVVADDGSTDGTAALLKKYEDEHPGKFRTLLSDVNRGITENSNAAYFACKGKYIAWMGGDDLMLPGKVMTQVKFMEAHPGCSICYHDLDVFDNETGETLGRFSDNNKPRCGDVKTMIEWGPFNGACSTMVRVDRSPRSGFNTSLSIASDWFYWIETLNNGGTIEYINCVMGRYRIHKNNVSRSTESLEKGYLDRLNTCNLIITIRPDLTKLAIKAYVTSIVSARKHLPYTTCVFFGFKNKLKIKYIIAILVYILSFGGCKF